MATITFSGYLAADPELKNVGGTDVLKLRIPVKTGFGDRETTSWYSVDLWGKQATALSKILVKGSYVSVAGELTAREYQANGQTRTSLDVRADRVILGPKTGAAGSAPAHVPAPAPTAAQQQDDEIPF